MTDIDAVAVPMASTGNWRAATHQYTKPRREVTAVVPNNELALVNSMIFFFNHRLSLIPRGILRMRESRASDNPVKIELCFSLTGLDLVTPLQNLCA